MALFASAVVDKRTIIDSLDLRLRVVMVFTQAILITAIDDWVLLLLLVFLGGILSALGSISMARLLKRVWVMDSFLVIVLLTLPLTVKPINDGDQWWVLFWGDNKIEASRTGVLMAWVIFLKANAILLFLQAFMGTMCISQLCHAATLLKLPRKLVFLMAFTLRYLSLIDAQYQRMRRAMKLRGFQLKLNIHGLKTIGYLVGMLLIRSLERSERIHQAMRCRGFVDQLYMFPSTCWQSKDTHVVIIVSMLQGAVLVIDQSGLL